MTPERVRELIAAYGAEPRRWPEAEQRPALTLLEQMPALRDEVARMAALDAALDRWAVPAPRLDAAVLAARISATPQRRPEMRAISRFRWPSFAWPNAAGLAAAALAGFLVGWSHLDADLLANGQVDSVDGQVLASVIEDATW
jgi:hypothetical protein